MAKSERKFRYQKRDNEAVRERANMRSGDFDSFVNSKVKMFKVHEGKNLIRILPPTWEDARHYGYDVWLNYGIGVDNQSYLSLSKMKGEKDPIADAKRDAERNGEKDLAKQLAPRRRIGLWIIDRMAEDEGPQFWAAPFSLDKDLANLCFDEDSRDAIMIDDPETGCDVRFYKEGTGLKTSYDASKMRLMKSSPIHQDEKLQEEWLEYVAQNPIPSILQYYDYDHISAVFDGQVAAKVKPDEDEDAPPPRRTTAKRDDPPFDEDEPPRPRSRVKEPDPDEDEVAEKPKSQGRTRTQTVEDDEETPPRGKGSSDDDEADDVAASSIKARLAARRGNRNSEEEVDEDEEAPPKRVRGRV